MFRIVHHFERTVCLFCSSSTWNRVRLCRGFTVVDDTTHEARTRPPGVVLHMPLAPSSTEQRSTYMKAMGAQGAAKNVPGDEVLPSLATAGEQCHLARQLHGTARGPI